MKTRKLHIWIAALFLSVFAFNATKAATTYTLALNADPSNLNNWGKTSTTVGSHPASFGLANTIFLINKAGNYTLGANWSVTAGSSYIVIGNGVTFNDGGKTFNASGNPLSFSVSTTGVVNLSGNGTIVAADIYGTVNVSGTASLGNTTIETAALLNVTGAATLSGVNPVSGTLTLANASATVSNLTTNSGGVVNLNATLTVASITANSGSTINFNANATIGSAFTCLAGSTVNINFTGYSIFPTTYSGNLVINNPASLSSLTSVNGTLTLNNILSLNFNSLTIGGAGTITGASTITGDNTAGITISSSAAIGTLNMTAGSRVLGFFDMSAASGSITLGTDLTIQDDGSQTSLLDLSSGTLILNGNSLTSDATTAFVTFGGTITGSTTSTLSINCDPAIGVISGTLNMDQTTSGTTNALSSFTMNDGGLGQTISLGNELDIIDEITPTAGTIDASGGSIKLVYSGTTKTGRVGVIGATGAITGSTINISIQRPGASPDPDWCLLGYPGIIPASQDFTWLQGQLVMQCPNCPDGYYYGFSSVQSWDEVTGNASGTTGYSGINNTTDAMGTTQGYWFYLDNVATIPITVTGSVQSANGAGIPFNLTNTNTGYNLITNPVPSPISWAALRNGNGSVSSTYAVYNPQSKDYVYYDIVTGSSPAGLSDNIAPGQGFMVQALAGTTMTMLETYKTSGAQALLRSGNNATQSTVNYFKMDVNGAGGHDVTVFEFNSNATSGYDAFDAKKMAPGGYVLQISSASAGFDMAINAQPGLTQNYSIPVKIVTYTTGVYQFTPTDLANMPAGACIKLHDNYTGTDYDVLGGPFSVTLNDTETVARFSLNVTITPLQITTHSAQATCHSKNNGYITAIGNNVGPWNYVWRNSGNVVVKTTLNSTAEDTLSSLNNGVYSVEVTTVGSCDVATQTFTLTAPGATTSAFTASSMTVNVNNNVTFTDNSVNADTYSWDFGDGNTSNIQNPVYAYAVPGNYNVQFTATNSACNESAVSNKTITVLGTTSIAGASSSNDEVIVGKDATGSFVKFNYANQTKVTINVYNALGQFVLTNASLPVVNDKIYLNLDNSKDQMLFVSISNLDKNTQVTKKLFNN